MDQVGLVGIHTGFSNRSYNYVWWQNIWVTEVDDIRGG